jgi:aspartate kinase
MRVFKFGGASVKDAESVRNVAEILKNFGNNDILVVVSAMGKMTNMFESLVKAYYNGSEEKAVIFKQIKDFHETIINDLHGQEHEYFEVDNLLIELECLIEKKIDSNHTYDAIYDQIVPFGELMSTKIISIYLNNANVVCRWVDARNFIITTDKYRRANVIWEDSVPIIQNRLKGLLSKQIVVTQGFIGRSRMHQNTTLGREGSDYTAAIFGYALDAESVTIWKDVSGVMNGDPKRFDDAVLIPKLSYNEAIELAYYGASVIHPKTIQPLKSKGIPLHVRSFVNLDAPSTEVVENMSNTLNDTPCYIVKEQQQLIKISSKDFSFIVEDNLEVIFNAFSSVGLQINLMQNSAISFFACFNCDPEKCKVLEEKLSENFDIHVENGMELLTIFNYSEETTDLDKLVGGRKIRLEQKSNAALQLLLD